MACCVLEGVFLLLCAVCAQAAINPRRELRVLMLPTPWGKIEEPASVFASVVGLCIAAVNFVKMRRALAKMPKGAWEHYPYKSLWYCTLGGSAVTSLTSVLFHSHDNVVTQGMDYTAAIWFIGLMACASTLRCFHVHRTVWHRVLPFVLTLVPLCWHSHYMFFVHFDYGWNMRFGSYLVAYALVVFYGMCAYELLLVKPRKKHFYWALAAIVALTLFAPAEIYDFIPIWQTIDGHSVWHVGMDTFAALFGHFVICDVEYFAQEHDVLHLN